MSNTINMADCSFDELLAEVGNLSIIDNCSETIKDFQKDKDSSLFDGLWSEDDMSEVETSLNLTEICSLNLSVDETDNVQLPALLSSNNVTVRRKTKTKRNISHHENAVLDSFPTCELQDKSPVVCRKLNDDFEHAENSGNSARTERCSEKHTAKEGNKSNCKENKSNIFTNSFSPVTNVQLQSDILRVPSIIKNNYNDQNVFEPKRKFDAFSTNANKNNSLTDTFARCDGSLTSFNCLNNGGDIVRSCDDESTASNKCISHQIIKHSELTNFEHGTAVRLGIKTDFKVSDENAPAFDSWKTDSVSSFIDLQLKADSGKKSPFWSCRPSASDAVETDALLSNKENTREKPESKKKVIILSSDSDSDSVWKDAQDFDDSVCGNYDISLPSRLGENSSHKKDEKTGKEIKTDSSTTKLNNDRKPSTSLMTTQLSESDDDDDDFEDFLDKMKTPKPKSKPRYSLKSFIVDDGLVDSSDDDDDVSFSFTTPKCVTSVPLLTPSTAPAKKTTLATLNERCLPEKKFKTPNFKTTPLKVNTKENTPKKPSSGESLNKIVTPYVNTPHKLWRKNREYLVHELFNCFNETVFSNKLPADLPILWNKQMTKTAGFCYYIGSMNKKCRIELSEKVVDSCDRIRDTLIHELCHAATWLIDGIKAGHGPHWKRWAHKATMIFSDLPPISRCHSYDIKYKFTYRCVKCQHSFGRHSKSVNLVTARCPYCLSHLELLPRLNKDGTPAKTRAPTKFSLFVKENYGKIKAKEPRYSHQQVMKELSKQFALQAALDKENLTKTT